MERSARLIVCYISGSDLQTSHSAMEIEDILRSCVKFVLESRVAVGAERRATSIYCQYSIVSWPFCLDQTALRVLTEIAVGNRRLESTVLDNWLWC